MAKKRQPVENPKPKTRIETLHEMAQCATAALMSFEEQSLNKKKAQGKNPKTLGPYSLSKVFAALLKEPPIFIKEDVDLIQKCDEFKDIKTHMQSYRKSIDALLPGHMGTIVVFFLPGTKDPIPLYLGDDDLWDKRWANWNGEEEETNNAATAREDMEGRIKKVAKDLRHHVEQKSDEDVEHFFFVARNVAKAMAGVLRDGQGNNFTALEPGLHPQNNTAGRYDSTIYAIPTSAKIEFGDQDISSTTWHEGEDRREEMAAVISSPVFVNHNSFALMASFFNRSTFKTDLVDSPDFKEMLLTHGICARVVFGAFYEALLRDSMASLPELLERTHISSSLLDESAKYLRKENGFFTYKWTKDNGQELYCSDLEADFFGDVIHDADSVFDHVLTTEELIYKDLFKEWDEHSLGGNPLPQSMPLARELERLEHAQRALRATSRDHIVHQFQVFLMGCLVIRKHENIFMENFSTEFGEGNNTEEQKNRHNYLLRLAWFLCSTMHDVGYPAGLVDDVVMSIRKSAGELLSLDEHFVDQTQPGKLLIAQVLYDDPRTYIILRGLAMKIAEWRNEDANAWWYFVRHLAFNLKHHAVVSVVALCLRLLDKEDDGIGAAEDFFDNNNMFACFIARHVFLPILMHHAYSWDEKREKILGNYVNRDKREEAKTVLDYLGHLTEEKLRGPLVEFKEFPLAVLLALCDILQEAGRPSGSSKDEYPKKLANDLVYDNDDGKLVLKLGVKYEGEGNEEGCKEDFRGRYAHFDRFERVFDLRQFSDLRVSVKPQYNKTYWRVKGCCEWNWPPKL